MNIWYPKLPITFGTAPIMVAMPIIKCLSLVYFSITFTMEMARGPCRATAVKGTIKTNYTFCCHHCQLCFWGKEHGKCVPNNHIYIYIYIIIYIYNAQLWKFSAIEVIFTWKIIILYSKYFNSRVIFVPSLMPKLHTLFPMLFVTHLHFSSSVLHTFW